MHWPPLDELELLELDDELELLEELELELDELEELELDELELDELELLEPPVHTSPVTLTISAELPVP